MNETFEDRLWDALKDEAERPARELPADRFRARPVRRPRTAVRVGLGLAAAAAIGTVLAVGLPGGGSAPAYAVEVQKDGAVKITFREGGKAIDSPDRLKALESRLTDAGIDVIDDPSTAYTCRSTDGSGTPWTQKPQHRRWNGVAMVGGAVDSVRRTDSGEHADVIVLHRGDTTWIERDVTGKHIALIEFMPMTCVPAHGGH
ncbi:hypothetical protein [Streptomyces odontomachi]|uniref:hypothetical protein n=1 Tax=Streptomyces odontomachi TaxID=2944940 RepID=UPI00210948DE|nr:hypothetical protein [Streptomyces sp. ODS25]